ncbi:RusA family crossover junction endodeoxyribonuclease [Microbacterium sp. Kw_RZR3]|uniref:RusA family crossover junction endodeoxyribonuclease n=1 Tax=Microbacterium sp. Kw_RZR3 TaxID=3032903 RepID=UPI0023DA0D80|nr:RusA family crossover junction endodeoxyribonuclease [Microbacterium sp. Kw_RZR3]MDF2047275.1 RusA family crossover junction endodeoxyribonuclease [Microbacterium sp. Kw_RZR3]
MTSNREFGWVRVEATVAPLSLQAGAGRRQGLKNALGSALSVGADFLFTHDVEVTLEWFATERDRYQTHVAADLDNVLKPLIDAATGPTGVMIDDNQVQSIRASWLTPGRMGEGFVLQFDALSREDVATRAGTAFVEFSADTCYMLPGAAREHWPSFVNGFARFVAIKDKMRAHGITEEVVETMSPIARPWHSQRLRMQGFPVHHHTADLSL